MSSETQLAPSQHGLRVEDARELLASNDPAFWPTLRDLTHRAQDFSEVLSLSTLRKKALRARIPGSGAGSIGASAGSTRAIDKTIRLAMVGGSSLYPLHELVEQFIGAQSSKGW